MKFHGIFCFCFAILALVFADVHMPDVYDRNEQGNGLFVPELSTGNDRKLEPSVGQSDPDDISVFYDQTATSIHFHAALREHAFASQPFSTDLMNPQKWSMPGDNARDILRRNGGAKMYFKALHMNRNGNKYNALVVTDRHDSKGEQAYWLAQGGYVDIPLHPESYQPKYVLTPAFSGCSLTADLYDHNTIRVRHVQGGYENAEYNDEHNHGLGLMGAMEYKHYAYHPDNTRQFFIENIHGAAFLQHIYGSWRITFQRIKNAPTIASVSAGRRTHTVRNTFSRESAVLSTEVVRLRSI